MGRVFSWKINDEKYAYLFIPNSKKHVSERITDVNVINTIIKKISKWSEEEYKKAFNEMNIELVNMFDIEIPYSTDFFTKIDNNNIIIMGSGNEKQDIFQNMKNELLDEIDSRFHKIINELNDFKNEMVSIFDKRTIDTVNTSKNFLNETVNNVNLLKTEIENKIKEASLTLDRATKIIDLDNNEINKDSLGDLFKVTQENKKWITSNYDDVERIKNDYKDLKQKMPLENGDGIFNTMFNKIEKINKDFINIEKENKALKKSLVDLETKQTMLNVDSNVNIKK